MGKFAEKVHRSANMLCGRSVNGDMQRNVMKRRCIKGCCTEKVKGGVEKDAEKAERGEKSRIGDVETKIEMSEAQDEI